jgi:hypothetical protein
MEADDAVCNWGQWIPKDGWYAAPMTYGFSREALVAAWLLLFAAVGLMASIGSLSGWLVLTALAVVPALVFLRFAGRRSETMPESIQQALR